MRNSTTLPTFGTSLDKIEYYQKLYQLQHRNSSKQAAFALHVDDCTLRKSRSKGYLLGVEAPRHIKIGNTVQYRIEDIIDWIEAVELENAEGM
jgi:hypothetical protein